MSRNTWCIVAGLLSIAAVEFTLLASSAAVPAGARSAPVRPAFGVAAPAIAVVDTPTPPSLPATETPTTTPSASAPRATATPTPTPTTADLLSVASTTGTPTPTPPLGTATATSTPTPLAAPQSAPSLPFIVEAPPPDVIEQIRAGRVPNVTLNDLGTALQKVQGAPALARVAPFAPALAGNGSTAAPIVGVDHGIALLVQYPDEAAAPGSTQASFQSLLFGAAPGSMRSYYKENSYNQYDIQGTVSNWVTVGHNRNWYADFDGVPNPVALCLGGGDDYGCGADTAHNTQTLIRDAVLAADPFVDFSAYAQGGVVRNLMIIHAGQGAEANGSCRVCAWSVAWGPSAPLVVDGVSIQSAFVAPEYTFTPGDAKIGVFAHEFGHLSFGLPDLYDTDYSSAGVGSWSLMASGGWLNGGATPGHLDAWSKIHNGWIVPTVVGANGPQTVPAAETTPAALKLWTNGSPGTEYFLVENRQRTGFDQYLPGDGLLIWHIDDATYSNTIDCHPHVLLVPADSGASLPCSLSSYGSNANPWPGSLNRTSWNGTTIPGSSRYSGAQTGLGLQAISASGPLMTANVSLTGAPLVNDNASGATGIVGVPFSDAWNTDAATFELGEASPCGGIGKTLWYRYGPVSAPPSPPGSPSSVPPAAGLVTVDTIGSNFDTVLAVYVETGASPPASLAPFACNDDAAGLGLLSRFTFTAAPGSTYYIQAGGYAGASGDLVVNADLGAPKGSIAGAVTNALGTPIAGAFIYASRDGCCDSGYATSGLDGSYTVAGLPPGNYRVQASGPYCPAAPTSPPCVDYVWQYYSDTYDYTAATPVTVTGGATTPNINFALALGGRIAGTVTNALGTPIAGAQVYANRDGCCGWGNATSGADGTYTITGLLPGSYRVQASGPSCPPGPVSPPCTDYASQYYNGTYDYTAATLVPVTGGATTTPINFSLVLGGSIVGTVTNALGTPIAGAQVYASRDGCCGWGNATTGADGMYTIAGLPSGSYRVQASGPSCAPGPASPPCVSYVYQYYNGTTDYMAATLVPVTGGATAAPINFALVVGGSITGTVTNALGTPIAGAQVYAGRDGCCGGGGATTGADGTYTIAGLPSGSYRVQATGPNCGSGPTSPPCVAYASQYYNGTYDYSAATLVPATSGATTPNINFALVVGGSIAGKVTNALSTPIAGAGVQACPTAPGFCRPATSASDGTYVITGLAAGTHRVEASGPNCPVAPTSPPCVRYVSQYYNGTTDYNAATLVPVISGSTTPNINFALALAGSISGVVTNALGTPIAGAQVSADRDGCCSWGSATTTSDGTYTIAGLTPGSYRVQVSGPTCPAGPTSPPCVGYISQYYNGTTDYNAATLVIVASGSTTPNINFALALGGGIAGTVTNTLGTPIAGAPLSACPSTNGPCGYATSGADGTYTITGLVPGSYTVYASGPSCPAGPASPPCADYAAQYYNGTYDWSTATLVAATSGATTPNINFALAPGGRISGKVTNALGTPIAGAQMSADRDTCCGSGYATSGADGTYTMTGLPPGNYRVRASGPYCAGGASSPPCVDYVWQYYGGTNDWSAATLVPVTGGVTTPNINFALAVGGRIAGIVKDALGAPIAGADVYASLPGCCASGYATSAADGTYTITGLPAGSYRVRASGPYCPAGATSPPCVAYAGRYYNGTYDYSSATLVPVTSGATTPNINFALEVGASLNGKVVNALGTPVAEAWVTADRNVGADGGGWATTGADGTYAMRGLAPGNYVISASVPSCPPPTSPPPAGGPCTPYPVWFYNGVCEYLAATHVPVPSGGTAPNIDITLRPANPDCLEHAVAIGGLPFTDTRGTAGATTAPGENQPCGNMGATVWYEYTAPLPLAAPNGANVVTVGSDFNTVSVDTVGSSFDTAVAVYSQGISPPGILTLVACKASGSGSLVHFTTSPGMRYFLQIGGKQAATGQLVVNVSPDTDGDGYTDIEETRLGRNPAVYCDIMRADVDYDGKVSILDLAWVAQWFTQNIPPAPVRFDQDGDHKITVLDLTRMAARFTQPVSACP